MASPAGASRYPTDETASTGPHTTAPFLNGLVDDMTSFVDLGQAEGGDEDSDSNFWDIIAGSHLKLENYVDQPYDQEMAVPTPSFMSSTTPPLSSSISSEMTTPVPLPSVPEYEEYVAHCSSYRLAI